jgi:hypothetical protein
MVTEIEHVGAGHELEETRELVVNMFLRPSEVVASPG